MARILAGVVLLTLLAVPEVARAQEAPEVSAVLDLTLNTAAKGEIRVVLAGETVWADVAALTSAGLVGIGGERRVVGNRVFVKLSSIDPAPIVVVDEKALALTMTADPALFGRTSLRFDTGRPDGIVYRRTTSAFLNYGVSWASSGARGLNFEPGVSVGRSLVTSSFFLASDGRPSRGLTAATIDDRTRLTRYQVGDTIAATGPLGGALQLGGVSISRDFSLDPYFVRYPTTGLSGVVTTPSRVDVYVNNQLLRSVQVQPGAYELANLALPTGAGDTRVVVRDAFGGEQQFGGSYYVTTSVLSRGLQQFQYAFGAERLRLFDTLWDYGRPVFTGTHRVGLTDAITLGGRMEVESGLVSSGPMLTTRLGRFGALEVSAAASHAASGPGVAGGVAYEYFGRPGGVSLAWRKASDDYENLTTRRSSLSPRRELLASATARLGAHATAGVSWHAQDLRDPARPGLRRASVSTTISLTRRLSLFVSATRTRMEGLWSTGGFAALGVGLGGRATATMSAESTDGIARGGMDVQQSAPVGPGFGYRLQAAGLGSERELYDGEVRAQARWGQMDLRQSFVNGTRETYAQFNGAVVAIGGRVLAARPVQDSFALVRVPDVKGVRAYLSHQEMGRTDRRGDLLVPNLLSYYGNQISIADGDVPSDRTLNFSQVLLATPFRGGAIAEFPATREWRVTGTLTAQGDAAILRGQRALDATLTIDTPAGPVTSWIASDGQFYLEGLGPGRYLAHVTSGDFRCEARLDVPEITAPVIQVGALACVPTAAAK